MGGAFRATVHLCADAAPGPRDNPLTVARIAVIGSPGAGKTQLSLQLGRELGLPVVHLDQHYWLAGWVEPPAAVWGEEHRRLVEADRWIIDGNYQSTMAERVAHADVVIYMDFPTLFCLWRATAREMRSRGKTRPDMAPGCPERFDFSFLRFILGFRRAQRRHIVALLDGLHADTRVIRLRRPAQVRRLVRAVSRRQLAFR